jgi:hypothetical protein
LFSNLLDITILFHLYKHIVWRYVKLLYVETMCLFIWFNLFGLGISSYFLFKRKINLIPSVSFCRQILTILPS